MELEDPASDLTITNEDRLHSGLELNQLKVKRTKSAGSFSTFFVTKLVPYVRVEVSELKTLLSHTFL